MTKLRKQHTFKTVNEEITIEQVIKYFGIPITDQNKILCVFHSEKTPSCHVYEHHLFCFGCKKAAGVFELAHHLLQKKCNCKVTIPQVFAWFNDTVFSEKSNRKYAKGSNYIGPVNQELITYWHNQLTEEMYSTLQQNRLFTKVTIDKYQLGWRPDKNAYVIPFWRGEPGKSEVDIVQFRHLDGKPKYTSLYAHSRGSVMNAHLLEKTQEYIVVLFGAYDPILALQDGLTVVGTNGSCPFKESEKERVQELFSKQHTIFIVPDNTPSEFKGAYKLAEWLKAEVRFFDSELPEGCDYIDYRKLGYTAEDFKQDVLGIEPVTTVKEEYIQNINNYLSVGDPYTLSSVYAIMAGSGIVAADIARTLAKHIPKPFNEKQWSQQKKRLWQVKSSDQLFNTLNVIAKEANRLSGAW